MLVYGSCVSAKPERSTNPQKPLPCVAPNTRALYRTNLYHEFALEKTFWGDLFEYALTDRTLTTQRDIFDLLDEICSLENLTPLHDAWFTIKPEDHQRWLFNALAFDLAFLTEPRMPRDQAQHCYDLIMSRVDLADCRVYTNHSQSPWEGGSGSIGLTQNTFDMAVVFVTRSKVVFLYVLSED